MPEPLTPPFAPYVSRRKAHVVIVAAGLAMVTIGAATCLYEQPSTIRHPLVIGACHIAAGMAVVLASSGRLRRWRPIAGGMFVVTWLLRSALAAFNVFGDRTTNERIAGLVSTMAFLMLAGAAAMLWLVVTGRLRLDETAT